MLLSILSVTPGVVDDLDEAAVNCLRMLGNRPREGLGCDHLTDRVLFVLGNNLDAAL